MAVLIREGPQLCMPKPVRPRFHVVQVRHCLDATAPV
jgi:hypothetical protein